MEVCHEGHGRVELYEVPSFGDHGQRTPWDGRLQTPRTLGWDPGVIFPPDNVSRNADRREMWFEFVRVPLVRLRDLPIEGRSARVVRPRRGKHLGRVRRKSAMTRNSDIGLECASMHRGWESHEDVGILLDQGEKRRSPRPQYDDIHQAQGRERAPMQEVRPKGHGTAVIVGNNMRPVQLPMRQK